MKAIEDQQEVKEQNTASSSEDVELKMNRNRKGYLLKVENGAGNIDETSI